MSLHLQCPIFLETRFYACDNVFVGFMYFAGHPFFKLQHSALYMRNGLLFYKRCEVNVGILQVPSVHYIMTAFDVADYKSGMVL